jgi:hypothetical protein
MYLRFFSTSNKYSKIFLGVINSNNPLLINISKDFFVKSKYNLLSPVAFES